MRNIVTLFILSYFAVIFYNWFSITCYFHFLLRICFFYALRVATPVFVTAFLNISVWFPSSALLNHSFFLFLPHFSPSARFLLCPFLYFSVTKFTSLFLLSIIKLKSWYYYHHLTLILLLILQFYLALVLLLIYLIFF